MNDIAANEAMAEPGVATCTLWQMVRYMLGLGTWGFGGPVALVGYMYRDLVEKRHWISESDYKEGLALAQRQRPGDRAFPLRRRHGDRPGGRERMTMTERSSARVEAPLFQEIDDEVDHP